MKGLKGLLWGQCLVFGNVSSPFSLSFSMSVRKSGFRPVPAPLSVQALCLRPVPGNRHLPGPPGAVPQCRIQMLVSCTNGLSPLGAPGSSVAQGTGCTCRHPGKPSTPSLMGRMWSQLLSPGCLSAQPTWQPLPGPALSPCPAVPLGLCLLWV